MALGCLCSAEPWLLPASHQSLLKREPSTSARDKNIIHVQVWLRHFFLAGFAPRFSHNRTDQLGEARGTGDVHNEGKNPKCERHMSLQWHWDIFPSGKGSYSGACSLGRRNTFLHHYTWDQGPQTEDSTAGPKWSLESFQPHNPNPWFSPNAHLQW